MLWIKRNLVLVIGIVLSIGLLGGAGYYLYDNYFDNEDQQVQLDQLKGEVDQLKQGIYPSDENISLVKSNTALAEAFIDTASRLLVTETYKPVAAVTLHNQLPTIIDRLRRDATNAGVELPPNYQFTFGEIKRQASIFPYQVEPLVNQLNEVTAICGVLFNAKVRALDGLQRVMAYNGDPGGPDLLTDLAQRTNSVATNLTIVSTPYRIVFRAFSSELSAVVNGISSAKEFMVIRQLDVDAAATGRDAMQPSGVPGGAVDPMMNPFAGAGTPAMRLPAGAPTPGAPAPGAPPGGAPMAGTGAAPRPAMPARPGMAVAPSPAKSTLVPVLDEKPVRVTIVVEVVKAVRRTPLAGAAQGK